MKTTARLVLGPINKQRWIYSCSKQLLDRVIWAYGFQEGLAVYPVPPLQLDRPQAGRPLRRQGREFPGGHPVHLNLMQREPIQLVDGGEQKRCFTYVDDGIDCL